MTSGPTIMYMPILWSFWLKIYEISICTCSAQTQLGTREETT